MIDGSHYALSLAYQWWLRCDAHFAKAELSKNLDGHWVRAIGEPYIVNRTIGGGQEQAVADLVLHSGQGDEMDIEERAARLSLALEKRAFAGNAPASAASKISWFVWPRNWTMYDSYAAKAVVGSPKETGLQRMERFYAALAMRGWRDALKDTRLVLADYGLEPLLAERAIDKFLFLHGAKAERGDKYTAPVDSFIGALPSDLSDRIVRAGEAIGEILAAVPLVPRNKGTDRKALDERVTSLRKLKKEIA